jgi:hypothetical protein
MRRRLLLLLPVALLLLIAVVTICVGRARASQKLRVTLGQQGWSQPLVGSIERHARGGIKLNTNPYPVISAVITNTTSRTYMLSSHDGDTVWCEYQDRIGDAWTNWTPTLGSFQRFWVLKPHSRLPIFIRLREDRGERRVAIICTPQVPSSRLPGILGGLESKVYRLVLGRRIKVPLALPPNNLASPSVGPKPSSGNSSVKDSPLLVSRRAAACPALWGGHSRLQ